MAFAAGTDWVGLYWRHFLAGFTLLMAIVASGHVILYKRDSRTVVSWVGLVWLVPLGGAVLYFIFGVNRIKRRAASLRGEEAVVPSPSWSTQKFEAQATACLPAEAKHLGGLARVVGEVVGRPLLAGNRVTPLVNGDETYPAMLEAIRTAQHSVAFSTYIFDRDKAGLAFADALAEARRRGVEVRVLIDATGTRYSWPPILGELRRRGVRHARFLPAFPLWRLLSFNLRNHRKILVVDGRLGFTGGLNIRAGHVLAEHRRASVQDIHFRIEGPVVAQLQEVFVLDWRFTTGEDLRGDKWFPALEPCGDACARGIPDGPDEDLDKLLLSLLAAVHAANSHVIVLTHYFLPDAQLISALNLAALRGVRVDIVLPAENNLPFVHWASRAMWWQVLERGCRLWLTPPPFDHSKLLLVDDAWALIGSANWDPRSLRLNFEFNVEVYGPQFARSLRDWVQRKLAHAHEVTLEEVDSRSVPARLRDGAARILTPYL